MSLMHRHRSLAPPASQLGGGLWALGFTLLLLGGSGGAGAVQPAREADDERATVLGEPLTQYRALRRMHARCERFDQEAWLEAWTELDGRTFRYEIVSERGSERVRDKVLRAILKREQELTAAGKASRSALTGENYVFEHPAVQEPGSPYVLLKPKRKDVLLVDGRMVLSADGTDLVRVEGRLAKNPSFWTGLVSVIRHYGRVNGVRVPVATQSTAKVKLAGMSSLDVRYEYETINNRPVSVASRRAAAAAGAR
jgi:hypothetical protein